MKISNTESLRAMEFIDHLSVRLTDTELQNLEQGLILGNRAEIANHLIGITHNDVARPMIFRIANLLSRSGYARESIKLLRPLVVVRKGLNIRPSDAEYLEYALALCLVGATQESLARFDKFKGARDYKFHFYYSAALITQWRYSECIEHLEKVVSASDASEYQKSVAKTNLVSALIFCDEFSRAEKVVNDLIKTAIQKNQKLVHGHCLEHAIASENWETVRDCDLHLAIFSRDESLLRKVYFGTPFSAYRGWILKRYSNRVEIPKTYDWAPAPNDGSPIRLLDVQEGGGLKEQTQLHNLLPNIHKEEIIWL